MSLCSSGKVGYPSPDLADHALFHSQSVAKKGTDVPVRWYYCHECRRYHLTSQKKKIAAVKDFLTSLMERLL